MTVIESSIRLFEYYKQLGEKTIAQLNIDQIIWKPNGESNSIAVIIQHLHGNMLSRWTNFLDEDGEKNWRQRDAEFIEENKSLDELLELWHEGWTCLFETLSGLQDEDLTRIVYIRNQGHTVQDAINRQLAHYPYHVGQMVYIGKCLLNEQWQSLSVPRGTSTQYNETHFSKPASIEHFTKGLLDKE